MSRKVRLFGAIRGIALSVVVAGGISVSLPAFAVALPPRDEELPAARASVRHGSVYRTKPAVALGVSLGALGLAALLEGAVRPALTSSLTCAKSPQGFCAPAHLLALDRAALGHNSGAWQRITDVGQIVLPSAALVAVGLDAWLMAGAGPQRLRTVSTNVLVALEAVSVATTTTTLLKYAVRRPRPRQYRAQPDLSVDGDLSFPSGHTTLAAAVGVATALTLSLNHPYGSVRAWAWGAAGVTTAAMATGRVLAGRHFPTDVLAGALVGGIAGLIIPLSQRWPLGWTPELGADGYVGLAMSYRPRQRVAQEG